MKRGVRQLLRLHTGRGLIALFAVTMFLPGILLAVIGVRAFYQERRLADQQVRERLERAADLAFRELELELSRWQQAVDRAGEAPSLDRLPLSQKAERDLTETPGAGVLVIRAGDGLRALPPGQVLYQLASAPAPSLANTPHPQLLEAETHEIREKDYQRAAALYRQLLATARPNDQALLLHRLARTNRKAGLTDAALELFQKLEGSSSRIGELPAELLAKYEICSIRADQQSAAALASDALELYRGLVAGRWRLERSRYFFYSETARNWLEASAPEPPEFGLLRANEQRKLALTRAVEQVMETPRRAVPAEAGWHMAFWKSSPFTA